jgi:hypothetical protein
MMLINELEASSSISIGDPQPCVLVVNTEETLVTSRSSAPGACQKSNYELGGLCLLLEDPVLALWADEAADRFGVAPLDVLDALAEALRRDAPQ